MEIPLKTGRGPYKLKEGAPSARRGGATVFTLMLERSDGIERVAFTCAIADDLALGDDTTAIITRLAPWIEREFEMTRESALKTVRSEHKMHEIAFDLAHRGPF
ncbi:MAG: hypothetical protein ACREQR_09445 [Candidatus Binataceae bacterium]